MNILAAQAALATLGGSLGGTGNGLSAEMNYRMIQDNYDRRFQAYIDSPQTTRDLDYFSEKIAEIESADDIIDDYRLKQIVMQAFGLEDLENSNHMLKRILTDDLDDEENPSLALLMNDPRFQDAATTLRLDKGIETIQSTDVLSKITKRYLINGFEKQVGEDSIGARQALYFQRNIGEAENVFQVMADPTLKEVARLAAGLPQEVARLEFDKQVELFEKNLDVEQFQDEK